jgi:hypothetical protein
VLSLGAPGDDHRETDHYDFDDRDENHDVDSFDADWHWLSRPMGAVRWPDLDWPNRLVRFCGLFLV